MVKVIIKPDNIIIDVEKGAKSNYLIIRFNSTK
jgi:hypothetical protein